MLHGSRRARSIPDVIESAATKFGKAHVIKSHHNVGGLPERMNLKLIEPLRELFKDEVRQVGLALGLPEAMVMRHPFPGPGLGVRILGEIRPEYADTLRRADAIFIEELRRLGLLRQGQSGVRGVLAGAFRWRRRRRAAICARHRAARGRNDRLHDGAVGAAAL